MDDALSTGERRPVRLSVHEELDARGLASPLPILRAHRALRAMQPQQVLKVVTSHPETIAEFQALAKYIPSYDLLSQDSGAGEFVHYLRRRR